QLSAGSHSPAEARQTVLEGLRASAGHTVLDPVQVSSTSQTPAAARHTAPALPAGGGRSAGLPSHSSRLPGLPAAVHAVPAALVEAARVAVVGARRPRRRLRIRRAAGTRAGAVVGRVTLARRGAAHRARRLERVGGTDGARAGAGLVHVAEAGGGAADRPGVA